MITRFAPTPSGYLHLGNAVHLRLLTLLAEEHGWRISLRIDDIDPDRTRPEYVADILDLVEWLDVSIAGDVYRQSEHLDDYVRARDQLMARGAYVCACSRTEWAEHHGLGCPRGCSGLDLVSGETALRIAVDGHDIVVWRREGIPAYHLASVVDEDMMGITHILRGRDLLSATMVQRALAEQLPGSSFGGTEVIHHDLLLDAAGNKLAKSAGHQAEPLPRNVAVREEIERNAQQLRVTLTTVSR
jgi:glutamyl/glutaminyl-tRNA synthetase